MVDEARLEAEALFEKYLGFSVFPKEVNEHIRLEKYGFELRYKPFISLVSIRARTETWGDYGINLGQSVWVDIPLEQTHVFQHDTITLLAIPPTLFGTVYTEVSVTYKAGLFDVPKDLQKAISTVETMIKQGEIDSWNRQMPLEVLEVIDSYKKEGK